MAGPDVYRGRRGVAYLVQVQSDFLDHLYSRSVVPLLRPAAVPAPAPDLHFLVQVADAAGLFATHLMAAVPQHQLGPPLASLADRGDDTGCALDRWLAEF